MTSGLLSVDLRVGGWDDLRVEELVLRQNNEEGNDG